MKNHRAFARKNAHGFWEGCIEYPCGTVSAVTNGKHGEGPALEIAQRMAEGLDDRLAREQKDKDNSISWGFYNVAPGSATRNANMHMSGKEPAE